MTEGKIMDYVIITKCTYMYMYTFVCTVVHVNTSGVIKK